MRPFIHVSKCLEHLGVTSLALRCFTWGLGVEWNVLNDYPVSPSKSATRMLIIDHNFFFGVEKINKKQMLSNSVEQLLDVRLDLSACVMGENVIGDDLIVVSGV